jgi:flagellar biosynthesis/type III secretory pathway protein FliH
LPLPLPAITEKDLQAARAEAQTQGYREGYAAAQGKFNKEAATREDAVRTLLEIVANRITIAAETHAQAMKERENLMARLVMASARKVAGEALRREPYAAVESLLRECMALIAGAGRLTIVASGALAPGLRQRIDTLKPMLQGFAGELIVEEDAALLEQDCRVEWGNGYGERTTEDLWKAIESIVVKTNVQG